MPLDITANSSGPLICPHERFDHGRHFALAEEDRGHRRERLDPAYAQQLLEKHAQAGHDPAHDAEMVKNRDKRGHEDDHRQHPQSENKATVAEQLTHFLVDQAAENESDPVIAVPQDTVHAAGDASQHSPAQRHKKHHGADGDLASQGGQNHAQFDRAAIIGKGIGHQEQHRHTQ